MEAISIVFFDEKKIKYVPRCFLCQDGSDGHLRCDSEGSIPTAQLGKPKGKKKKRRQARGEESVQISTPNQKISSSSSAAALVRFDPVRTSSNHTKLDLAGLSYAFLTTIAANQIARESDSMRLDPLASQNRTGDCNRIPLPSSALCPARLYHCSTLLPTMQNKKILKIKLCKF